MSNRISQDDVTVRPARPSDAHELLLLAALDSAPTLKGEVLIAEIGGRVVAAKSLDGGRVIADPFVRTAALAELLELRAQHLRARVPARELSVINRLRVFYRSLTVRGY